MWPFKNLCGNNIRSKKKKVKIFHFILKKLVVSLCNEREINKKIFICDTIYLISNKYKKLN